MYLCIYVSMYLCIYVSMYLADGLSRRVLVMGSRGGFSRMGLSRRRRSRRGSGRGALAKGLLQRSSPGRALAEEPPMAKRSRTEPMLWSVPSEWTTGCALEPPMPNRKIEHSQEHFHDCITVVHNAFSICSVVHSGKTDHGDRVMT